LKFIGLMVAGILLSASFVGCSTDFQERDLQAGGSETDAPTGGSSEPVCVSLPLAKQGRSLGMDIANPSETGDFGLSLIKAKAVGIGFFTSQFSWTQIEVTDGAGPVSGNFEDPSSFLLALKQEAEANGLKISLNLRPVDTTGKTVPSDLSTTRFNHADMLARFTALLDFVFSILPPELLLALQVGNEIDTYDPGSDVDFWSDYGAFLFGIRNFLGANYPSVKLGFTGTFSGLTSGELRDSGVFVSLSGVVDVVGVTYYPMDSNFIVKNPTAPVSDFATLANEFPGKAVSIQEAGYQTGELNGSNELKQSQFICSLFEAWDNHAENFQSLSLLRLHDLSQVGAENLALTYGISDPAFIEYLRTLGLVTFSGLGTDKPAYQKLKEQTELRGW